MLILDGVYIADKYAASLFRRFKAPTSDELSKLTHTIIHRAGRYLERRGLAERDAGNTHACRFCETFTFGLYLNGGVK